MKIFHFIERYFWIILIAGIILGLSFPVYNDFLMSLLKPLLMLMLLLVFLKTDLIHILTHIKDYKLMAYLVGMLMIVIPLLLFIITNLFNRELAIGILLFTAMPAAVSSPTFTDIVKGNSALSSSLAILTSIVAPFTIPFLFRLINYEGVTLDTQAMFTDLAILVFIPLVLSEVIKKLIPVMVIRGKNKFTSFNILIIFVLVYIAMGSQRELILSDPLNLIWKVGYFYIAFIILQILGHLTGIRHNKENQVAIAIGTAYRNNGMAIVLAAIYFEPAILILMVLSELPWNTLLAPYKKILRYW